MLAFILSVFLVKAVICNVDTFCHQTMEKINSIILLIIKNKLFAAIYQQIRFDIYIYVYIYIYIYIYVFSFVFDRGQPHSQYTHECRLT